MTNLRMQDNPDRQLCTIRGLSRRCGLARQVLRLSRVASCVSFAVLTFWTGAGLCMAQQEPLAHDRSERQLTREIRIWGSGPMEGLLRAWEAGFRKSQPGVRFSNELLGNDSALGGVYTAAADMALMDREPLAIEADGFEQAMGRKALGIEVAYGSLRSSDRSPALAVFVHRDSPLTQLTIAQLDSIFSATPQHGIPRITQWSSLGIDGPRGARPIHLYGFGVNTSEAFLFEKVVFKGKQRWNCNLHEYHGGGHGRTAAAEIATALARDPDGIAIATLDSANASIKTVKLGFQESGPYASLDEVTMRTGEYPLARPVYVYLDRKPGAGIDLRLKKFLSFVVSKEGQAEIGMPNSYLPLPAAVARESAEELQ